MRPKKPTAIIPAPPTTLGRPLDVDPKVREAAGEALRAGKAKATWRAYDLVRKEFAAWCEQHSTSSLPASPEAVRMYLAACAEGKVTGRRLGWSSLCLRRSWISQMHQLEGLQPPTWDATVRLAMSGYRRGLKRKQKPKDAVSRETLRRLIATFDISGLHGLRDRALLLVGFGTAMRRSELVAIQVENILPVPGGLAITIEQSKTDQEGKGQVVGLERIDDDLCPVMALEEWLAAAGITSGPVFRGFGKHGKIRAGHLCDHEVATVIHKAAAAAGIDQTTVGAHSLRAGLVTHLLDAGVDPLMVAARTRHQSLQTLIKYYRPKNPVNPRIAETMKKGKP
jgi:integrase